MRLEERDVSPDASMLSATQMADYLREVTSIVDATKGTLQLEILIHLYERGPQGVDEISKALGRRRKAVTDALRKLRLKEVVMEVPGSGESDTAAITYVLTDQGKDHVGHLKGMFESKGAPPPPTARREGFRLVEMIEEVPLLFYTTDAIIALGLAGNKGLPVRELARLFGLSERRAVTYLDLFMDAPGATLFKKKEVSGAGPSEKARYMLTENGWRIFRLIPSYSIQYTSLGFRLLMAITASVHPRQLFPRIALTIALGSIVSLFSFAVPALFPFAAAWISFLVFIGGVLMFDMLRVDLAE